MGCTKLLIGAVFWQLRVLKSVLEPLVDNVNNISKKLLSSFISDETYKFWNVLENIPRLMLAQKEYLSYGIEIEVQHCMVHLIMVLNSCFWSTL